MHGFEHSRLGSKPSVAGAPRIGCAAVPAAQVVTGELIEGWLDLLDTAGHPLQKRGKKVRLVSDGHMRHLPHLGALPLLDDVYLSPYNSAQRDAAPEVLAMR